MAKYFKSIKSYDDLKNQYKKLLKANHPDNGGDLEAMKEINVEYGLFYEKIYCNPGCLRKGNYGFQRKSYDRGRSTGAG